MKNIKIKSLIIGAMFAITVNTLQANEGGTGGTTEGGDYKINIYNLLPTMLTINAIHLWNSDTDIKLGSRECYGILGMNCDVFMNQIRIKWSYINPTDYKLEVWAENWMKGKLYSKPLTVLQNQYDYYIDDPDKNPKYFDRLSLEFVDTKMSWGDSWTYWDVRSVQPSHLEIKYNGFENISLQELQQRLKKIEDVVFNQLDLIDFDTVKNLVIYDDFLTKMGLANLKAKFEQLIFNTVGSQADEILKLAMSAVDISGNCNQEIYDEVLSKLKHWVIGNGWYFYQLESYVQYTLLDKKIKVATMAIRQDLRAKILDSVTPNCETSSRESLTKLSAIFKD